VPRISVSKVKLYWKKHGTLGLVKLAVLHICLPFFSYHLHNFYGMSGLPRTQVQPRCLLDIRKGGPEDIGLIVDLRDDIDEADVHKQVKDYFDNGGELFLGFSEGKLVHTAWLFYNLRISEIPFFVKIRKDEAYIGNCYTHPEFRGKNIYPVVLQHMLMDAAAKNKKRCFITTIPINLASIRGIEKSGFSFVGKMRMFKLFGKFFNNQWDSSDTVKSD